MKLLQNTVKIVFITSRHAAASYTINTVISFAEHDE